MKHNQYPFKIILFLMFLFTQKQFCGAKTISSQEILDSPIVISLERHLFRYHETKANMEKVGFTNVRRFDAIDGFSAPKGLFEFLHILSGAPGQRGCAASHLLAWLDFANESTKSDYLFVCEDDMLPHSNFSKIFPIYWHKTPKDFDIVMVGNSMHAKKRKQKSDYVVSVPSFCTHAYIIR